MTADAKAKEEACERTEPEPEPESMITNDWIGMQRIEQLMSVYVHVQYSAFKYQCEGRIIFITLMYCISEYTAGGQNGQMVYGRAKIYECESQTQTQTQRWADTRVTPTHTEERGDYKCTMYEQQRTLLYTYARAYAIRVKAEHCTAQHSRGEDYLCGR